jgi:hypothetical protein
VRVISAELEVGEIVLLEISLPLDLASKINLTKDKMITRMASLNFLRTPASVSDTAKAAAFLASEPGANDDWNSP